MIEFRASFSFHPQQPLSLASTTKTTAALSLLSYYYHFNFMLLSVINTMSLDLDLLKLILEQRQGQRNLTEQLSSSLSEEAKRLDSAKKERAALKERLRIVTDKLNSRKDCIDAVCKVVKDDLEPIMKECQEHFHFRCEQRDEETDATRSLNEHRDEEEVDVSGTSATASLTQLGESISAMTKEIKAAMEKSKEVMKIVQSLEDRYKIALEDFTDNKKALEEFQRQTVDIMNKYVHPYIDAIGRMSNVIEQNKDNEIK